MASSGFTRVQILHADAQRIAAIVRSARGWIAVTTEASIAEFHGPGKNQRVGGGIFGKILILAGSESRRLPRIHRSGSSDYALQGPAATESET